MLSASFVVENDNVGSIFTPYLLGTLDTRLIPQWIDILIAVVTLLKLRNEQVLLSITNVDIRIKELHVYSKL